MIGCQVLNKKLGPSKHLSWSELSCRDGTPYPVEWRGTRAIELAAAFEKIRNIYGKPIRVISAFRTPEWNKKIGGAKNSQHLYGRALDLLPPEGISAEQFYFDIRYFATSFGITGLGRYKTFVHIDTRPSKKLIVWTGKGWKDFV